MARAPEGLAGRLGVAFSREALAAALGGEKAFAALRRTLTVHELPQRGRPAGIRPQAREAFRLEARGDLFFLPRSRAAALVGLRGLAPLRPAPPGPNAPLPAPRPLDAAAGEPAQALYSYQAAAVDFLCGAGGPLGPEAVAACRGVAYLELPTGLGKSRIGCAVAVRRGAPALVVVPTKAIAAQWLEEAAALYPRLRAGHYENPPKGSKRAPPSPGTHDLVVVIIDTFRKKGPEFLEGFGTTIFDEAHELHSPCNYQALWLAQTPAVLGLSATPRGHPSGLDRVVALHLGPPLGPAAIPGFDASAVRFSGRVRAVRFRGHPSRTPSVLSAAGSVVSVSTIAQFARDPARLALAADEIERLFSAHLGPDAAALGLGPRPPRDSGPLFPAGELRRHGILVFAEHRDFLLELRDALLARRRVGADELLVEDDLGPEATEAADAGEGEGPGAPGADPSLSTSILRGGVARTAVRDARALGAHVVFATYGFGRRGISLPQMTALVLATPRCNGLVQVLGRILRRGSDESIVRQVVDIVDDETALRGQFSTRKKAYLECGFPVSTVKVGWEDFAPPDAAGAGAGAGGGGGADSDSDTELSGALAEASLGELMAMLA